MGIQVYRHGPNSEAAKDQQAETGGQDPQRSFEKIRCHAGQVSLTG